MKALVLIVLVTIVAGTAKAETSANNSDSNSKAQPQISCTDQDVDTASSNYDAAVAGFGAGQSTVLDVKVAKMRLQDLMVCSNRLPVKSYCGLKSMSLSDVTERIANGEKMKMYALSTDELSSSKAYSESVCPSVNQNK
jgi:hypothetical protein